MSSLGSLVVSLAMDTARFTSDVGKATQQMARLSAEAGKIGAAIGANIGAGIKIIGSLVKSSIDAADASAKMAQSYSTSIEEITRLGYAAELSGASQEELGAGLKNLSALIADAAGGAKDAREKFAALGVSFRDVDGNARPTIAILEDVADRFASYKTSAEKTAFANEIFGKSGQKLIPLLNQGKDGLRALAAEADALGITLTDETGAAAEQFNDNLTRLNKAKEGLGRRIAEQLLPLLSSLTDRLFDSAKSAGTFDQAARVAATGVKVLVSAGAILVGIFKTIGEGLGGVAAAVVAAFSGRFREAYSIIESTSLDFVGNIKSTANNVALVWDETAGKVRERAPKTGEGIAAPIIAAAKKTKQARDKIAEELARLNADYEKQLKSATFDVATFGASDLTKRIIEISDAVGRGLNPETARALIEQLRILSSLEEGAKQQAEAEQRRQEIMRDGIAVFEATRTPAEALASEIDRLNFLLSEGAINWDTYARAIFSAQDKYDAAIKATKEQEDAVTSFVKRARENIQDGFGDALVNAMNGKFKSIGDSFVAMLQRMVAEALAAKLAEAMFGEQGSSGGGIFGSVLGSIGSVLFGGKAIGGPVSAGVPVITGEHGREVFVPATAGTIVPNSALGGSVLNLTVNVAAAPGMSRQTALQQGQQIGEGIQRAIARNG